MLRASHMQAVKAPRWRCAEGDGAAHISSSGVAEVERDDGSNTQHDRGRALGAIPGVANTLPLVLNREDYDRDAKTDAHGAGLSAVGVLPAPTSTNTCVPM
jgi:hypothetical protein